ncbi:3-deoxy-D-manno-octulosonic acid transferase [Aestuariivita boseongensis]|uniref:3-deoxy-D-manno-octulosonic acid transferase n=1 Tax=Aestuariivita boseongensis TaxID=1470562 RepID=UPI00067FBCA6|nr:glycosyltransferase N-terminal domain-containing protein [Aestuariivita boseongensis]
MARSLTLAAYRALQARGRESRLTTRMQRPEGELIWMHATSHGRLAAMQDVARRLKAQRPGVYALITISEFTQTEAEMVPRGADWVYPFGPDTPGYTAEFLDHWRPDLCIWTGGYFLPNALMSARDRGMPMILVDADENGVRSSAGRWIPTLAGKSLSCFDRIFASGNATAERLIRKGIPMEKIAITAPLQISANPPSVNEDHVDETTQMLAGRLVWMAAHVQSDEVGMVLDAHATAARLSHRLLLVLTPGRGTTTAQLREAVDARGLRCVDWDEGEEPDDFCQVIIAEGGAEIGHWYRVAPVVFLGSSLTPGHGGSNPFDAAALGSAVLYGPNVRDHLAVYTRLASAGAARIVKDAEGLATGVMRLIAPDNAASMALAAWEVVSEGAQITDQLLDLVQDLLDQREGA